MEQLLHYVWKHKLFPPAGLTTTQGQVVEVLDSGLHNHNAGPDFFNAKVKVGGVVWAGNVEVHERSSDWYHHHHETDAAYDNVVLHVVGEADREVTTRSGRQLVQLVLPVPVQVKEHYDELQVADQYPPCYRIIPKLSRLTLHSWMSALLTERLEQKTLAVMRRVEDQKGDWEKACFITLARSFGFGINGFGFESWADTIPLDCVAHHRDNPFQVEAFFLGMAGLLEMESVPERYRETAQTDAYFSRLQNEFAYLSHKFQLHDHRLSHKVWRFLRLRPQNFPHIRLSQLAHLYVSRRTSLSILCECETLKQAREMLQTETSSYWEDHFLFGAPSSKTSTKHLSKDSIDSLIINTVSPVLFAYGRYRQEEKYCQRAIDFLETLKAERNHIVENWRSCGLAVDNAADSQALIQLKHNYCERKDCLRCRIGHQYLTAQAPKPPKGGCERDGLMTGYKIIK